MPFTAFSYRKHDQFSPDFNLKPHIASHPMLQYCVDESLKFATCIPQYTRWAFYHVCCCFWILFFLPWKSRIILRCPKPAQPLHKFHTELKIWLFTLVAFFLFSKFSRVTKGELWLPAASTSASLLTQPDSNEGKKRNIGLNCIVTKIYPRQAPDTSREKRRKRSERERQSIKGKEMRGNLKT